MAVVIKPRRCVIESSLDRLADAIQLSIVENDAADPTEPQATAWRTLDEADLIRVRLGLVDEDLVDYGTFRVDKTHFRPSPGAAETEIWGRDEAALLIEETWRQAYGFRPWRETEGGTAPVAPLVNSWPTAWGIAAMIAARVGLGLVWDAPNFFLSEFTIEPRESASAALGRVLDPLRQSRRYYVDAWVWDGTLYVRRRGNGPIAGTIDARLGIVTGIQRARSRQVGAIDVYGATYVTLTVFDSTTDRYGGEDDDHKATVEVTIEAGKRTTKKGTVSSEGAYVVTDETVEEQSFDDVWNDAGQWVGRVLTRTTSIEKTNLSAPYPTERHRDTTLSYDAAYRMRIREERVEKMSDEGELGFDSHRMTTYEQITPTDIRTTVEELTAAGVVKKKTFSTNAGVLRSSVRQIASPDQAWEQNEDGSTPSLVRGVQTTAVYQGSADGGGSIPRVVRLGLVQSGNIVEQIADDLAAESGAWHITLALRWPRPFPFRKSQRITVTNLPVGTPDATGAVITSIRTSFDEDAATWVHEVSLEYWLDP